MDPLPTRHDIEASGRDPAPLLANAAGKAIPSRDGFAHRVCMPAGAGDLPTLMLALQAGGDPNSEAFNERALHLACLSGSEECVKALLEAGADPNLAQANQGMHALHLCSNNGRIDLCRLLLAHGAAVDPLDHKDYTPLHHACMVGNADCAELLLSLGANPDSPNHLGRLPMDIAANSARPQATIQACLASLIKAGAAPRPAGDSPASDPMLALAKMGHWACFEMLLGHGCSLSGRTHGGQGCLHIAAQGGAPKIIELCLQAGMPVDERDSNGRSALFHAASFGRLDALAALALSGADLELIDGQGLRPLHAALELPMPEAASLLISLGADPKAQFQGADCFAFAAARAGQAAVDAMLQACARLQAQEISNSTPDSFRHDKPRL